METQHVITFTHSEVDEALAALRSRKAYFAAKLETESLRGAEKYHLELKLLKIHRMQKKIRLELLGM